MALYEKRMTRGDVCLSVFATKMFLNVFLTYIRGICIAAH